MTKKKKSRRKLYIILAIVLLGILAAAAYFMNQGEEATQVDVDEVSKRTILESVAASGKIFPKKEVKISSDVSGEIVGLYVAEGDSVVQGQVIAKIEPEAYESAVDRGRAAVNNAKSQLAMSKSQIEASKAQKQQIIAQLTTAEQTHNRNVSLHKDGIISDMELEQSQANVDVLKANIEASNANIRSSEQSTEAANYTIKSAEASLKELKTSLKRTTILAPVSGTVSSLSVEAGERVVGTIQMTGTELMRIANLNDMEVQVEVSENDIPKLSLGDTVDISVDAYLKDVFKGEVIEIAHSAANATGATLALNSTQVTNFAVSITLNPDSYSHLVTQGNKYPFRPGMSASVDIYTEKRENILSVPIQSVTARINEDTDKQEEYVYIVQADTVLTKIVQSGTQDDKFIEIKTGLETGQKVVSGPYSVITSDMEEGAKIEIKDKDDKNKKSKKG